MDNRDASDTKEQEVIFSARAKRWLGIIAVLGLIFRLLAAYLQPAFIDEGFVYYLTKTGIANTVHTLKIDAHPPTFNIIIYPLVMRTANIFLLRLPWVCLSILTIVLSFRLLRRFFDETDSLFLTALYASGCGIIITDAQLRTYGPLTLCLTVLWIGLLDIHQYGRPFPELSKRRASLGWGLLWLCGCAGAGLHYLGILSLAMCCIPTLFLTGRKKLKTLFCLTSAALPSSLWLIWSRMTSGFSPGPVPTGLSMFHFNHFYYIPACLLSLNINILKPLCADNLLGEILQYTVYQIALPLLTAALWIALISGWFRLAKRSPWTASLLGCNLIIAQVLLLGACVLGKLGYSQARYSLPMTVPFFILLFSGISEKNRRQWQAVFLVCSGCLLLLFPFYPPIWNQYWGATLKYINSIRQPNDIIAVCPAYTSHCFAMEYDPDNIAFTFDRDYKVGLKQKPSADKLPVILLDPAMRGQELLRDLRGYRVILIMCQEKAFQDNGALLMWLDQYYNLVGEHHFVSAWDWADVNTYVLEAKPIEKDHS